MPGIRYPEMIRYLWAYLVYMWGGTRRHIGIRHANKDEYLAAARLYARAFALDSRLRPARLERAILLWRELDRCVEAIAEFDALLAEDPADGKARFNRAMANQQAGHYRAALNDIEYYLQLPEAGDTYWDTAMRMQVLLHDLVGEETG
jgi:tetratricopeptide (TPR) repeat protein